MKNTNDPNDAPVLRLGEVEDHRSKGSTSSTAEERLKKLYKSTIAKKIRETFEDGNIKDLAEGKAVDIPYETPDEYRFFKGKGGDKDVVHPGNDQYRQGDRMKRKDGEGGGGSGEGEASNSGEGEDDFSFAISQDEYLDLLFEGCELNMEEKEILDSIKYKLKRLGLSGSGMPSNMDYARTKKKHIARRAAFGVPRLQRAKAMIEATCVYLNARLEGTAVKAAEPLKASVLKLIAAEVTLNNKMSAADKRNALKSSTSQLTSLCLNTISEIMAAKSLTKAKLSENHKTLIGLMEKIDGMLKSKSPITVMDDKLDGVFANFQQVPQPAEKAVMFCLMDVSGSMDQRTKDIAKRFYILLCHFLMRIYNDGGKKDNVELVFIRHHTQAKECDEEEFFYGRETGGTIVSSGLTCIDEIIKDRYPPSQFNIFIAQASDGDNWADDTPLCGKMVRDMIREDVRYFTYIEITERAHQSLWNEYQKISDEMTGMGIGHITAESEVYPVFRKLFSKDNGRE
ncbi:MAG: uncharacterized sporulation protein YeaH/YhbH (DUF444 family) [Alphaproteobacteria bacterium]|jgi:uncharacterized sporulation protein YeaH/YhbH (DUF444 family)